jgi:hypothetical protein
MESHKTGAYKCLDDHDIAKKQRLETCGDTT